jgi:hypothetical protein
MFYSLDCFTPFAMTDTPEIAMTDTRVVKKRQVEMHPEEKEGGLFCN